MAKKKKQTVGYKYFASLHAVLCHGPIDSITKISFQEKDAYLNEESENKTIAIDRPALFGGEDQQGGVQGNVELLFGRYDQQKSTLLGKILSKITNQFSGLYSAWRGVTSVVFDDVYIGTSPNLPDSKWRVKRIHTRHDGGPQWYDEKAEINSIRSQPDDIKKSVDDYFKYAFVDGFSSLSELQMYAKNNYNDQSWAISRGPFGSLPLDNTRVDAVIGRAIMIREKITLSSNNSKINIKINHDDAGVIYVNGNLLYSNNNSGSTEVIVDKQHLLSGENLIFAACINTLPVEINLALQYDVIEKGSLEADINPAHIIRECLTNKIWGIGVSESSIDDISFKNAADTLFNENMGMSIKWTDSTTIDDFINTVKNHTNAQLYLDRLTNKWKLYLIRDDYNESDLISIDESSIKNFDFERRTLAECVNAVTVTYWDRERAKDSTVTVQDIARIAQQGGVVSESIEYTGFTNQDIAGRIALRDLKTLSANLASVSFDIPESVADSWHLGMPFKLSFDDYGLSSAIMRVTKISSGDGRTNSLYIEAKEDVFSSPMQSVIEYVPSVPRPSGEALNAESIVFEVPYIELVEQYGQDNVNDRLTLHPDIGYAGMASIRPNSQHINANLYIDAGAGYDERAAMDFCPNASIKNAISYIDSVFEIENAAEFALLNENNRIQVNDELMAFVSFNSSTNILTVKRGCFDTVPKIHAAGSKIYGWDNYSGIDNIEYIAGENVNLKALTLTSIDQLSISRATAYPLLFNSRAIRPYPPANVKINGEYYPAEIETDLILTWVDRNRLAQTGTDALSWFDVGIAIEPSTQTWLVITEFDENDVELATNNANVTGVTMYTRALSTLQPDTRYLNINLKTLRDGYECLNPFSYDVALSTFFSAPYDLTVEFKND